MQEIFSPMRKFGTWRRLWLALAESQAELGLEISEEALSQMRVALDKIDLESAAEYERRFRHDVMAHVHLFGDAAPAARAVIHLGATSAFIGDNTDLILHREALTLTLKRAVRCISALAIFAEAYASLPTLGYTHFQPAQPTTVGKRATLWAQDLLLDLEELEYRISSLRFRGIRGTTGTQASFLELFNGDHSKVDALDSAVGLRMGFENSYSLSGQTYPRKVDFAVQSTLAGVATSLSKIAHDWRILAHLREVEEPFESEQIGSSAMPYKRNPMRAERICALARHVIVLAQDPAVVEKNLAEHLPFMATETILMHATARGGDRQDLHERMRKHSIAAATKLKGGSSESDLIQCIAEDKAFDVSAEELEDLVDPNRFIGRAPEQVAQFLREQVTPMLERLGKNAEELQSTELHV
jgi:adenylosuccinate lyase